MLDNFKEFRIIDYISINDSDLCDFDSLLISDEELLLIKRFNTPEKLEELWENQMHFIAGYIQNKSDKLPINQSHIWNTYIVYCVDFDIDTDIKLMIENSKFCCKKFVVDIRFYDSIESAIASELPALTELDVSKGVEGLIQSETEVRERFTSNININEAIKKYFIECNDYSEKSMGKIVNELIEVLYE